MLYVFIGLLGLFVLIALALIPAKIASEKGYGYYGFFILGIFFFIPALIIALCLSDKNAQVTEISNAIEKSKTSTSSAADELTKYYGMLQQGIITPEEFEAQKQKQLNR